MFKINNNDFKILVKYKDFLNIIDSMLENIPRKDMFYKDKIRYIAINLLHNILLASYEVNNDNLNDYKVSIKSDIALLDFMLDRLYQKRYINEKCIFNCGQILIEINKMTTGWINSKVKDES